MKYAFALRRAIYFVDRSVISFYEQSVYFQMNWLSVISPERRSLSNRSVRADKRRTVRLSFRYVTTVRHWRHYDVHLSLYGRRTYCQRSRPWTLYQHHYDVATSQECVSADVRLCGAIFRSENHSETTCDVIKCMPRRVALPRSAATRQCAHI